MDDELKALSKIQARVIELRPMAAALESGMPGFALPMLLNSRRADSTKFRLDPVLPRYAVARCAVDFRGFCRPATFCREGRAALVG